MEVAKTGVYWGSFRGGMRYREGELFCFESGCKDDVLFKSS